MAGDSSKIEILGRVPLFARCSKKELKQIAPLVDELRVSAGRELITEGRGGEEAFVIVSGTARVSIGGQEMGTAEAGDTIGEMALLDPAALRSATVTATSDMELLVIGAREFHSMLLKHPQVTLQIAVGLAERLREHSPVRD